MAAFSRAIKVMERRAASYAGAARGMLGARALRRPAAHRFDTSGRMARLERVVSNSSRCDLEELEVGLPSAIPGSARRENRSEKVQRRINGALAQADGGSAWGAGAGAAATLARDACKGNGRVCYGARCAAGGGSPGGEVSLLAACPVTS